ncbi:MAG: hypothetical protein WKF87_17645 [Chryseolinea sp.]
MAHKSKNNKEKTREKAQPDDGQGAKGDLGSEGDYGKPEKKADKESAPIPIKKNND